MVQEVGYAMLRDRGIQLIAADDPDAFTSDTPTAIMVRQILGAVAQFEKAASSPSSNARVSVRSAALGDNATVAVASTAGQAGDGRASEGTGGTRRALRVIAGTLALEGHVSATGRVFGANRLLGSSPRDHRRSRERRGFGRAAFICAGRACHRF